MKLLIVEDYVLVAISLKTLLIELGHEVVGMATNHPKAVLLAGEHKPDLALMDIRLADNTSGVDAAQEIHRKFGTYSLYVSAYLKDADRVPGTLGCLLKPYLQAEIRASLVAMERILRGDDPGRTPHLLTLFPENFPKVSEA